MRDTIFKHFSVYKFFKYRLVNFMQGPTQKESFKISYHLKDWFFKVARGMSQMYVHLLRQCLRFKFFSLYSQNLCSMVNFILK